MTTLRVTILDPGAYTPYYDHSLCQTLSGVGCSVEWATAPFIHDELPTATAYRKHYAFGRVLTGPAGGWLAQRRRSRRVVRAIAYPAECLLFLRHLEVERPHVLHLQWALDPRLDAWWLRQVRKAAIPLVYTAHNVVPHLGEPTRREGWREFYYLMDAVITHSHANQADIVARFGLPRERVRVLPMGNLNDFRGSTPDQRDARRQLGLSESGPVVLFFGLIKPYKGVRQLLDAFAQFRHQRQDAKLMVVGRPNMDWRPFAERIEALGLDDCVHIDLRYVPWREVGLYFAAADLVVLPYIVTSQSAVLLTAYTYGRPVITTATGGLPELVDAGRSGWIVPPRDVEALSSALAEAFADPAQLVEMGAYAKHLADTRHAWPEIGCRTLDVYRTASRQSDTRVTV